MSVLLINPPALERVPARIVTPPLGLAYLSAALRQKGIPAAVLDADALDLTPTQLQQAVEKARPRIIGLTAMTPTSEAAYRAVKLLRGLAPTIIIGGPHVSAAGGKVFEECQNIDAAFVGESEEILPRFAARVIAGEKPSSLSIPGVLTSAHTRCEEGSHIKDLDALPFPDRDSLPRDFYHHPLLGGGPVTTIITSRGCPYRCVFCDKTVAGSRWRPRSPGNVVDEIQGLARAGLTRLILYDDLFTLDRHRAIAICKLIIDRGIRIRWKCEGRVNRVDPGLLEWMKRAGCEMIAFGVETVTAKGLAFLRKDITTDQVRAAFAMSRAAGIATLGYFILGIPGETIEDELETARFAVELGADYAQFGVLSPLPGTDLHRLAVDKGWLHEAPARGPAERGARRPVIFDGYWDLKRLDDVARQAHRIFYFRPSYVARRAARISSPGEALAMAEQGLRLGVWWLKNRKGG